MKSEVKPVKGIVKGVLIGILLSILVLIVCSALIAFANLPTMARAVIWLISIPVCIVLSVKKAGKKSDKTE